MTRYHLVSLECDRYARRAAQATLCCSLRYDCLSITRPAEQNTRKQIGPSNSSSNAHASSPRCRRIAVCRRASLGAGILWLRVLLGPLLGRGDGRLLILFPALGDVGGEGVVGVGGAEQGLDGEEDGPDLQRGGPVVCRRLCQYACPVFVRETERRDALFRTSRQMRPSLSTLGWKIFVRKRILGGVMG